MHLLLLLLFLLPSIQSTDTQPKITQFEVTSRIQLRFASTEVVSHVVNPSLEAQEVKFEMRLPEKAFISHFSMLVNGVERNATVQEKEAAKQTYEEAREVGIGAGLVSRETEDTSLFSVATNVPANQTAIFTLHYDELLIRKDGWYEHTVNLEQDKVVPSLKVEVFIEESLQLSVVEARLTDSSRSNLIQELEQQGENTDWDQGRSHILYQPDIRQQEEAHSQKAGGQFSVRYKVSMDPEKGEVQVIDGYFVHFTEDDPKLDSLPKYTVFVLDVSGSMRGEKIIQLRDAMFAILDDMNSQDYFSIITFNSYVQVWSSDPVEEEEPVNVMIASDSNKDKAIAFVISLAEGGGTNINAAMLKGLEMIQEKMEIPDLLPNNVKPMVVFLTDGQATSGVTYKHEIKANIRRANSLNVPLYCLAFGSDADFRLMKEISQEADSWAKMIYEGGDAAIQLENFYAQIASPVISNLTFNYVGIREDEQDLIREAVKTVYKGSSYVHIGKIDDATEIVVISMIGEATTGRNENRFEICLRPNPVTMRSPLGREKRHILERNRNCISPSVYRKPRSQAQNFLQKLHAYVHIRKLINRDHKAEVGIEADRDRALTLALENNFVTEITSLVVTDSQDDVILATVGDVVDPQIPDRRMSGIMHSPPSNRGTTPYDRSGILHSAPSNRGTIMNSPIRRTYMNSAPMSSPGPSSWPRRRGNRHGSRRRRPQPIIDLTSGTEGSGIILESGVIRTIPEATPQDIINTTTPPPCDGNITLFSSTYHRGDNVTIETDTENLLSVNFDNRLVSVSVSDCCWNIFTDPFYSGEVKKFSPGETYQSVSSVGKMFRAASSIQKIPC